MIELLRGKLADKEPGKALIDVNGVGYGVLMPERALMGLPETGAEVTLHTHLVVREDDMTLFGFLTREEREAFRVFIGVKGIGPRTALVILSTVSIDQFAQAIVTGNASLLVKIPGIGRKTAERIILEMKDRVQGLPKSKTLGATPIGDTISLQAIEALMALGVKPAVAEKAVAAAREELGDGAKVEDLIRVSLKHR
ncbi:Holliday junction branch migration protein RuvA [Candidatus Sumerlaeota bacterium]|nr:Holliday junction branch migration protein RuvA [Candidatus Sumerlaeota bacterium]